SVGKPSARNRIQSTTLKMAAADPMPRARVRIVTKVNRPVRHSERGAYRMSEDIAEGRRAGARGARCHGFKTRAAGQSLLGDGDQRLRPLTLARFGAPS